MNSKYNQKIFEIGRKHFPEANDMEIMSVWNNIQQKDPSITLEQVDEMMPHIKAGLTEKGIYQAPQVNVPQAQAVDAGVQQQAFTAPQSGGGGGMSSMADVAKMKKGADGNYSEDDQKKLKMKALQSLFAGGK